MLRHPLFTIPVFAGLAILSAGAVGPAIGLFPFVVIKGVPLIEASPYEALAAHAIAAAGAALLGSLALTQATVLTRLTLFLFFLILTFTLPLLGIIITAALVLVLRQPASGGVRPEERFVFGNPEATAARRESRNSLPSLTPLAEGFRSMDEETLCQAILGLKHLGPTRSLAPFLQRFQQDPRTTVQFTAQAVISSATETLEETIHILRHRLAMNPADSENRLALADTLDQLTGWTPPGDATTAIRRREATAMVTEILMANPRESRALRLLVRLQLAAASGPAAQLTAASLSRLDPSGDTGAHQALLESLFHEARWDDLSAAARLTPPPPGLAEPHTFWTAAQ